VFPDSKTASYLLPMKRVVRDAAGLIDGDSVHVRLRPVDL
jgi:hypothetical protein